jgi:hypothetical protein
MVNESTASIAPSGKKRLSHRRKQIYLQIIAGIIILSCGIVIGSGATLLRLKDRVIIRGPRPPLPDIVEDIQSRYDLTHEQVEKVEDILGRSRETMRTIFDESREKAEAEFQRVSLEMKEVLSPEQYEHWENDFKSRRRGPGRFGPGGPGPGRPGGPGPGRFGPGRPGPGRFDPERPDRRRYEPTSPEPLEPNSAPE